MPGGTVNDEDKETIVVVVIYFICGRPGLRMAVVQYLFVAQFGELGGLCGPVLQERRTGGSDALFHPPRIPPQLLTRTYAVRHVF